MEDINLKDSSFIYLIEKDSGEINNIRGFLNGFQINSFTINGFPINSFFFVLIINLSI